MFKEDDKKSMKNFTILTTPRTGSTWLGTLLDSHPDIKVYGELFLPYDVPEKYEDLRQHDPDKLFRFKKEEKGIRPWITWKYLDHVFSYHPDQVGSFKLMAWPLIKNFEILFYLKGHKIPVIYLKRNLTDRVLSYAIAQQRKDFHSLNGQSNDERITLDLDFVKRFARRQRLLDRMLSVLLPFIGKQVLTIDYDALEENTGKELYKIYDFLGVSAVPGDSPIEKSVSVPYKNVVENYDDVMKIINH